jgi:large subunit ribosomal protein L9
MRRNREARQAREREAATALASQFEGRTIAIKARAGAEGKLFGSVTAIDIAEAVHKQTGAELDRRKIDLDEPLKELGGVDLQVRLHPDVVANLHVEVEAAS